MGAGRTGKMENSKHYAAIGPSPDEEIRDLTIKLTEAWEELSLLYQLAGSLSGVVAIDEAIQTALSLAQDKLETQGAAVIIAGPDDSAQIFQSGQRDLPDGWVNGPSGQSFVFRLLERRHPLIVNRAEQRWQGLDFPPEVRNLVGVAVNPKGGVKGVLLVWNKCRGGFTAGDGKLLSTISAYLGGVIETVYLYKTLSEAFEGILLSLATAVDAKSRWTAGHSHRTTRYAVALAKHLGNRPDFVEKVRISGLLHDVGKIGIPDAVLEKPDRLTPEEFELIKKHPEIGYRILEGIRQFRGDILDGVLYHHERVDGKGYPRGLRGEEIPFIGRLLAVADGFDAMTSDRPYRPGKSKEEALQELVKGAGSQWDQQLVLAFVEMMQSFPLLKDEESSP